MSVVATNKFFCEIWGQRIQERQCYLKRQPSNFLDNKCCKKCPEGEKYLTPVNSPVISSKSKEKVSRKAQSNRASNKESYQSPFQIYEDDPTRFLKTIVQKEGDLKSWNLFNETLEHLCDSPLQEELIYDSLRLAYRVSYGYYRMMEQKEIEKAEEEARTNELLKLIDPSTATGRKRLQIYRENPISFDELEQRRKRFKLREKKKFHGRPQEKARNEFIKHALQSLSGLRFHDEETTKRDMVALLLKAITGESLSSRTIRNKA